MTHSTTSIAMKCDTLKTRISATKVRVVASVELHSVVAKLQKLGTAEALRIGDELLDLADSYLRGNEQ